MTGLVIDVDVRMTTRDGVSLAADVYRPADGGPFPALLHRTPYDRSDPTLVSAIVADPVSLARQGYAVVVQDVRGRFGSGGEFDFFHQEQADGFDAVEWAAAQPWCDGRVGIYGSSYHAMTTYQAVAAQPPHLRAAVAMIGATDLRATTHPGGLFELGFLTLYGLGQSVEAVRRLDVPAAEKAALLGRIGAAFADPHGTVSGLPVRDLLDTGFWADWIDGAPGAPTLLDRPDLVDVPLLQVVAFRDFMAPTMLELGAALLPGDRVGPVEYRPTGGERGSVPNHLLIAGPWAHSGTYTGHVGSRTYPGATGGVGTWGPVIAGWFDRHLKERTELTLSPATRRLLEGPPVAYYVTGENRWAAADTWPPPGSTVTLPIDAGSYRSDPADPFPTCGGASSGAALGPDGVQDRRAVEARDDVLLWTSEPLSEPLCVAGPVRLVVALESTAPDVDVCVHLVDVEPDGFAAGISEGALRVRTVREGWLEPGEVVELTVPLHDTAHTFRAGHRVRVEVAGANFPRLSRNLHTREVPEHGTAMVVAEQTVHGGRLELRTPYPLRTGR